MRKGFLFSIDALLSAILLIGGLLLVLSITNPSSDTDQISSASQDLVVAIDELELHEINDPWVQGLLTVDNDTDGNLTVLEQIGLFWAEGDISSARKMAEKVLDNVYPGFGLRLTIDDTVIYNRSSPKGGKETVSSVRMMTGVAAGEAVEGSSAAAYLRKIENKRDSIFITFGGFVGEGNFSVSTGEIPSDANITDVILEVDASRDFQFWINGESCDNLSATSVELSPDRYVLSNCTGLFSPGVENKVSINFSGDINGSFVAGGYVEIKFTTDTFSNQDNKTESEVYRFPHIQGLINLYDGLYIPGNVSNVNISLYFLSNYTSYLTVGNASWQFPGSENVQERFISNTQFVSELESIGMNLSDLTERTVPLRFGIGDVEITGVPSDTIIVTDTSGSMGWCVSDDSTPPCPVGDRIKLDVAKDADYMFIDYMLNNSGPQLGLVEFGGSVKSTESLTTDATALKSEVSGYTANGGTCICCAINSAVSLLNADGQIKYIPRDSDDWKYNYDDLSSPPVGWTDITYDDSSWVNAETPVGWGYWFSGINTYVPWGSRYEGDYFYRHEFEIPDASAVPELYLYVASDDGADVYLNGNLIDTDYPNTHGALYWNRFNISVDPGFLVDGTNILAVRQYHSGSLSSAMFYNLELVGSVEARTKNILLMTDGEAQTACGGSPKQDAIDAACDAYNDYGIKTYTVGFGTGSDPATLQAIADCANGEYFLAEDEEELIEAFSSVGSSIIRQSGTQRAIIEGSSSLTVIYSNSTIHANYTPLVNPIQANEISLTVQSEPLENCTSVVRLFKGSRFVDAKISSYSDDYWTSVVVVNNQSVYNISEYSHVFSSLGDPYRIEVPPSVLLDGNNTITTGISVDSLNFSDTCSGNNTVIYSLAINLSTERSDAVPLSEGCKWNVEYVDGTFANLTIPSSYTGTNNCTFNSTNKTYNDQDAYQLGAFELLDKLDFSNEGRLYVNLAEEDLEIVVTTISGVPYLWGPALARIEVSR